MKRFIGIKDDKICIVSENIPSNINYKIIEAPTDLEHVSSIDLMNCRVVNGALKSKLSRKVAKDLKVAFVTNWAMKCGISLYAQTLFPEIAKLVGEIKLFIEDNEYPTGSFNIFGNTRLEDDQISTCWKRGFDCSKLVQELKAYEPDLIVINHEYGLFPNASHWLSMMTQLSDYRVITVMHSIFPQHRDKTIIEASIPEIIVHLPGAKNALVDQKQIMGKVYVIPHGCTPCTDRTKLWNMYKSDHTFIQQGFLFRYKGFTNSIEAIRILRDKYPDVFFTGLCSESPFAKHEHNVYYNELMELVYKYGIENNIALIRGYQSDAVLDSFLRVNKVAIFPYIMDKRHECFGSSGAAPFAMSKGIPVISSNAHHFSGLPTIKAETPEEIANALDQLFSDKKTYSEQIEKQVKYLEENTWENIALQYIKVFENKFVNT